MKQINWQDSFQGDALGEDVYADRKARNYSQPSSYTDWFTNDRRKQQKKGLQKNQKQPSSFRDRYIQTDQNKRKRPSIKGEITNRAQKHQDSVQKSVQDNGVTKSDFNENESKTSSGTDKKVPVFEFNERTKGDRNSSESWHFLNLKNKKQTGDLYKKILFLNKKNDAKVYNFLGSRGREGVTTIFANLVEYVNSQTTEKKILVIDANSKSPSLHKVFNISPKAPGLLDIFNSRSEIHEAIIPITSHIFLLCCGKGNANSIGLGQENFIKLIDYCKSFFDFVFIDCAPVLSSTDALNVAPAADYNFLIIQSANDQKPVIEKSKSLLLNDECKVGGVILNRVQQVIPNWLYKFI